MEQITITKRDGTTIQAYSQEPFCTPTSVEQSKALMSDDTVKITLRTSQAYTFGKGDKVVINGEEYKIRTQPERTLQEENDFVYNLTFYGVMYDLMKCQFRNCDANGNSTKAIFDLTYSLLDFAKVIIYNMNRDNPNEWVLDQANVPTTEPITISFSKQNCLQVLQDLCSEDKFDTEFRITQSNGVKTIHIGSFGSVVNPPSGDSYFEYGKGSGLFQLTEKKVDDKAIITRLWAEGGTQNVKSGYRDYSDRIQFPYPQRLNQRAHTLKDGTVIAAGSQTIGISNDANRYMEDTALSQSLGVEEDTQTFDDIYPKRTGTISALGSSVYEFVDSSMDFDLNAKDSSGNTLYLIDGTSAKLTFITGLLAGQEFELSSYNHTTKTFKVIKYTDERGLSMPTEDTSAFRFAVGDQYKITDINMPDSYVQAAEEDLWYKALDYFNEAKVARVSYELTFDRKYFLDNMPDDSTSCVFAVGDYVPVKDTRFNLQKNIRIQKVTRDLTLDHDYKLTLSDTTAISIVSQAVIDVGEHEKIIEFNDLRDLAKARRGWRTTEELRNMVYDTDGYFDNENIRPNSIDTNMLTVGSKSQQFVLTGVILAANVNGYPNQFSASAGVLSHLTINEDSVRSWNMSALTATLTESGGYYVFAKCSKSGTTGVWYVTQSQLQVEPTTDPNNYYFLVGIIGSLSEGGTFRDFTTTYGFTRINGNTITTGKIITSDGNSYLDLDGNKFKIGNATRSIAFNENGDGKLTLKNVDIDSGAGDPVHLGVYRGVYDSTIIYYTNDEVSYTSGGKTCTYRYINVTAGAGHTPTDGTYWSVVAQGKDGVDGQDGQDGQDGEDGQDGDYFEYRYAVNGSRTTAPSLTNTDRAPSGWTTTQPSVGTLQYLWCTIAKVSGSDETLLQNWSTPTRITPYDGQDGEDGEDGEDGKSPALAYRGGWSNIKTYSGSQYLVEAVKYNSLYYITRIDAGTIPKGTLPTNTTYWNSFGAEFESVATSLLLAEEAVIENAVIRKLRTSDIGAKVLAEGNSLTMIDASGNTKLKIFGDDIEDAPSDSTIVLKSNQVIIDTYYTPSQINSGQDLNGSETLYFISGSTFITTFNIESDVNSVKIPDLTIQVRNCIGTAESTVGYLNWDGYMRIVIDDDIAASAVDEFNIEREDGDEGWTTQNITLSGYTLSLSKGTHSLKVEYYSSVNGSGFGTDMYPDFDAYITAQTSLVITYPIQVTAVGANGFRAMFSGSQYADFVKVNGTPMFVLRDGNSGIKLTNGSLKITFNGGTTWYTASRNSSTGALTLTL